MVSIDPIGAFQRSRLNRLAIQEGEQRLAQQPARNRLLDMQIQQQENQINRASMDERRSQLIQQAQFLNQTARSLRKLPFEQRAVAFQMIEPNLEALNVPKGSIQPNELDDVTLDQAISATEGIIGSPDVGANSQFGAQETFKDTEGNLFFGTQVRNPGTGQVQTRMSPIGAGPADPVGRVQVVGSFGETSSENLKRRMQEAQGKADIDVNKDVESLTGKARAERIETVIDTGIAARSTIPTFERMLELIDSVRTGGIQAGIQRARQLFGWEAANLAELDALFKEAVLGSIRQLGANPTEGERKFMIEASGAITQNPEVLKRLINRRKAKAESAVSKAQEFAQKNNDEDALSLLNSNTTGSNQGAAGEGQIMIDAQGNRAIVFPDGSYKEID